MNFKFLKYFLTLSIPFLAYVSFNSTGVLTYAPILEAFFLIPVLELFFKPSNKNITEAEEEMSKNDISYDIILYMFIPIIYFLIWEFLVSMKEPISTIDKIGRILSMGLICGGFGINIAHELGHRNTKYEQFFSKVLLLPSLYMHFFIEHNRGHHKRVSTVEDPSSARFGENIFSFWFRAVSFGYLSAWNLENSRLNRNGNNIISLKNEMLLYQLIQIIFLFSIYYVFGFELMLYFICCAVLVFYYLRRSTILNIMVFKEIKMIEENMKEYNHFILGIQIILLEELCYLSYQDIQIIILTHLENIKF